MGKRIHLELQLVRDIRLHFLCADGNTRLIGMVQLQLDPTVESNFTVKTREPWKIDDAPAQFDKISTRVLAQITGAAQLGIEILPMTYCQPGRILLDGLDGVQA